MSNDWDEREPVGCVRQLRLDDGGIIEDPMDQGGRQISEEGFLEGSPRREIAIPNGENRLLLADCGPPELGLAYVPVLVHPMLSSRMCGSEAMEDVVQRHVERSGSTREAWP